MRQGRPRSLTDFGSDAIANEAAMERRGTPLAIANVVDGPRSHLINNEEGSRIRPVASEATHMQVGAKEPPGSCEATHMQVGATHGAARRSLARPLIGKE